MYPVQIKKRAQKFLLKSCWTNLLSWPGQTAQGFRGRSLITGSAYFNISSTHQSLLSLPHWTGIIHPPIHHSIYPSIHPFNHTSLPIHTLTLTWRVTPSLPYAEGEVPSWTVKEVVSLWLIERRFQALTLTNVLPVNTKWKSVTNVQAGCVFLYFIV